VPPRPPSPPCGLLRPRPNAYAPGWGREREEERPAVAASNPAPAAAPALATLSRTPMRQRPRQAPPHPGPLLRPLPAVSRRRAASYGLAAYTPPLCGLDGPLRPLIPPDPRHVAGEGGRERPRQAAPSACRRRRPRPGRG
jgi:hypothetical protein